MNGINDVMRGVEAGMHDEPIFTDTLTKLADTYRRSSYFREALRTQFGWTPMVRLARGLSRWFQPWQGKAEQTDPPNDSEAAAGYVVSRYLSKLATQRIIRSLCREYGLKCPFVWQPCPFYKYDGSRSSLSRIRMGFRSFGLGCTAAWSKKSLVTFCILATC